MSRLRSVFAIVIPLSALAACRADAKGSPDANDLPTKEELATAIAYYESKVKDIIVDYHIEWGRYEGDYPTGRMIPDPGKGALRRWAAKGPPGGPVYLDDMANVYTQKRQLAGWLHNIWAFNGEYTTYLYETAAQSERPKFHGRQGVISAGMHRKLIPILSWGTPEHFTLRYFSPVRFSDVLKQSDVEISGIESLDGYRCIVVEISKVLPLIRREIFPLIVRMWLDQERGFCPLRIEVRDFDNYCFSFAPRIRLREVARDVWFPVSACRFTYGAPVRDFTKRIRFYSKYTARQIRVNTGLSDDFFALKFAPGTGVTDERYRIKYHVGWAAQVMDALASAIVSRGRKMLASGSGAPRPRQRGWGTPVAAVTACIAFAGAVGIILVFRRKRRFRKGCMLVLVAGLFELPRLGECSGEHAKPPFTGQQPMIAQSCGVNSLLVALRWLDVSVAADRLWRLVQPDPSGASSLAQLARAARTLGVPAVLLEHVGADELFEMFSRGRSSAVLYLKRGRKTHFITLLEAKGSELLGCDFPNAPKLVPYSHIRVTFEGGGGRMVLLGDGARAALRARWFAHTAQLAKGVGLCALVAVVLVMLVVRPILRAKQMRVACCVAAAMLCGLSTRAVAGASAGRSTPRAVLPNGSSIRLGEIPRTVPTKFGFDLSNAGGVPLVIKGIGASCGCMTVRVDRAIVPPGAKARITGQIRPDKLRGEGRKLIRIETNDPARPVLNVTVSYTVVLSLDWEPKRLYIRAKRPKDARGIVVIFPGRRGTVRIKGVRTEPAWLRATALTSGESSTARVEVRLTPEVPDGYSEGKVTIEADDPEVPKVSIPVEVYVQPLINVDPPALFFGFARAGERKCLQVRFTHRDGLPLSFGVVMSSDPRVVVQANGNGSFTVCFIPDGRKGKVSGQISFELLGPAKRTMRLKFLGFMP